MTDPLDEVTRLLTHSPYAHGGRVSTAALDIDPSALPRTLSPCLYRIPIMESPAVSAPLLVTGPVTLCFLPAGSGFSAGWSSPPRPTLEADLRPWRMTFWSWRPYRLLTGRTHPAARRAKHLYRRKRR
ncbi:hypothetical protein PS9374_04595 [Planomonospora sphaerica]|uniref:Uncharacterized protein n=1 Tax=Planomonospora sphaerica TaxID=161355 RepID=A0A171DJB5_9ACTN|nr:hypothetical protein [Planomonospora sphaerica]GAT68930.1 hypothetical protein PS9374_04595 [Planomonospora sphaerica]